MAKEIDELKRYGLEDNGAPGDVWIDEAEEGDYLRRDDVLAAVAAIEERLRKELAEARREAFLDGKKTI